MPGGTWGCQNRDGQMRALLINEFDIDPAADVAVLHGRLSASAQVSRQPDRRLPQAGAVIHGWESTNAEVLGVIDADLQHPPELLPRLWDAVQSGADAAVASRYAPQGSLKNWSKWRHLISLTSIWITLPLQRPGISVKDPMSGFFLVRRTSIEGIELQKQGFKILLEILVRGKLKSVIEVPFEFGHRYAGESKAGLKVAVDYFILLAKLWLKR